MLIQGHGSMFLIDTCTSCMSNWPAALCSIHHCCKKAILIQNSRCMNWMAFGLKYVLAEACGSWRAQSCCSAVCTVVNVVIVCSLKGVIMRWSPYITAYESHVLCAFVCVSMCVFVYKPNQNVSLLELCQQISGTSPVNITNIAHAIWWTGLDILMAPWYVPWRLLLLLREVLWSL